MFSKRNKFIDPDIDLRLKSIADGILRAGPLVVRFGVSRNCNYNCVVCWDHSPYKKKARTPEWKSKRLDSKLVLRTIKEIAGLECRTILFSGSGEPFTHPDLMEFIEKAKKYKITVRVPTNLSLVDNINQLAKYMQGEYDVISVNLMAATAKTFVQMHPNQNVEGFSALIKNIKLLTTRGVNVRYIFIINRLNYQEIEKANILNKKLGTKLFLEMMNHTPGDGLDNLACSLKIKNNIFLKVKSLIKDPGFKRNSNAAAFIEQIRYSNIGQKEVKNCIIGFFFSNIDELGNVYFCCTKKANFLLGNIKKQSFEEIWYSKKYQELRIRLLGGGFFKECRACLGGACFKARHFISPQLLKKHFQS